MSLTGWFAVAETPAAPDFWTLLTTWGPGGVVVGLLIFGLLVPKPQLDQARADRDAWKLAYEKEREGHEATRSALRVADERAAMALESGRTLTTLLQEAGHRPSSGGTT